MLRWCGPLAASLQFHKLCPLVSPGCQRLLSNIIVYVGKDSAVSPVEKGADTRKPQPNASAQENISNTASKTEPIQNFRPQIKERWRTLEYLNERLEEDEWNRSLQIRARTVRKEIAELEAKQEVQDRRIDKHFARKSKLEIVTEMCKRLCTPDKQNPKTIEQASQFLRGAYINIYDYMQGRFHKACKTIKQLDDRCDEIGVYPLRAALSSNMRWLLHNFTKEIAAYEREQHKKEMQREEQREKQKRKQQQQQPQPQQPKQKQKQPQQPQQPQPKETQPKQPQPQPKEKQTKQPQPQQPQPKETQPKQQPQPQPKETQPKEKQPQPQPKSQPKETQPQPQPQPKETQPQPKAKQPKEKQPKQPQQQQQPQPKEKQPQPQPKEKQPKQPKQPQPQPQPKEKQPKAKQPQPQPQPQPKEKQPKAKQPQPQPKQQKKNKTKGV